MFWLRFSRESCGGLRSGTERLHVFQGGPDEDDDQAAGDERREAAMDRANDLVERARRRAAERDQNVDTAVETGDPAETILDAVAERDVDQVVMGGHGGARNELARRLLGTVATAVVSEAPVTVTVVR